jgi:hypothetical protein
MSEQLKLNVPNLEHLFNKLDKALEQETTESLTTWLLNKRNIENIYVVKYNGGMYDDGYEITIFATFNKDTADKYVEKFNKLLNKWKEYYSLFQENNDLMTTAHFDRASQLYEINRCFYEITEIR